MASAGSSYGPATTPAASARASPYGQQEDGGTDADTSALVAAMLADVETSDNPVLAMKAQLEHLDSVISSEPASASTSAPVPAIIPAATGAAVGGGNDTNANDLFGMLRASTPSAEAAMGASGSTQEGLNSAGFPMRPGAEICHFFMKTGACRFGAQCKKDHPERPGAIAADPPGEKPQLNSAGLPMRPGRPQCAFYVKTGICKFGDKCVHDHPEKSAALGSFASAAPAFSSVASAAPAFSNGSDEWSSLAQELRESTTGSTSVAGGALNGFSASRPAGFQSDPASFTSQSGVDAMIAGMFGGQMAAQTAGGSSRSGLNSAGFPMRPGAEICHFFMKTGTCRFGANCKKDHPEKADAYQADLPGQQVELNSKGLPIRPGRPVCAFFQKTGICKFGSKCVHDHPDDGARMAVPSAAPARSGPGNASPWMSLAQELRESSGFSAAPPPSAGFSAAPPPSAGFSIAPPAATGGFNAAAPIVERIPEEDMEAQLRLLMEQGDPAPAPAQEQVQLNTRGLPIRPGKPQCKFYMQTGKCSFGATCVNNHPEVDALVSAFVEAGIATDPSKPITDTEGNPMAAVLAAVGSDFGW